MKQMPPNIRGQMSSDTGSSGDSESDEDWDAIECNFKHREFWGRAAALFDTCRPAAAAGNPAKIAAKFSAMVRENAATLAEPWLKLPYDHNALEQVVAVISRKAPDDHLPLVNALLEPLEAAGVLPLDCGCWTRRDECRVTATNGLFAAWLLKQPPNKDARATAGSFILKDDALSAVAGYLARAALRGDMPAEIVKSQPGGNRECESARHKRVNSTLALELIVEAVEVAAGDKARLYSRVHPDGLDLWESSHVGGLLLAVYRPFKSYFQNSELFRELWCQEFDSLWSHRGNSLRERFMHVLITQQCLRKPCYVFGRKATADLLVECNPDVINLPAALPLLLPYQADLIDCDVLARREAVLLGRGADLTSHGYYSSLDQLIRFGFRATSLSVGRPSRSPVCIIRRALVSSDLPASEIIKWLSGILLFNWGSAQPEQVTADNAVAELVVLGKLLAELGPTPRPGTSPVGHLADITHEVNKRLAPLLATKSLLAVDPEMLPELAEPVREALRLALDSKEHCRPAPATVTRWIRGERLAGIQYAETAPPETV